MKGVEGDLCLWINQIILSALRQDLSLLRNQSGEQRLLLGKESLACPWVALPSPSQALLTRLCPAGLPVNRAGPLAACNALVSLPCSIPRKAGCAGHEAAELCELWCLVPASSLQGKASHPARNSEILLFFKDLSEMLFDLGSSSFPPDCCTSG